jgi:hypothetical protein
MTGIYSVRTHLQRIGVAKSSICPHCQEGVPESLTRFACVCPKFKEARTSAHNQVRDVITSFFTSTLSPLWKMFEETRTVKTGLVLRPTSPTKTSWIDDNRIGFWYRKNTKRLLSLTSDVTRNNAQLLAAAMRKQQAFQPLVEALSHYTEKGWVLHVFPWVVGIRGMIDSSHVESVLKFIGIQERHWRAAIERVALASAFHFLHKVRFGGSLDPVRPDLDPDDNISTSDDDASDVATKRKYRKTGASPAPEDSDS